MIELISKFFISYKNNLKTVGSPLGGKGFNTHASTLVLTVTGGSTDLDMDIELLPVSVVDSLSLLEGNCTRDSPHLTHSGLRQYTCPQIIGLDTISLGFLVYIDAVCRL